MATFMLMMIPRAAVCADRIGEVLDTESVGARRRTTPVTDAARARHARAATASSSATPAPTRRCCATSRFRASPGQTRRSSASTGAGKTTLVNLVPRLFDVTGGAVLVDGVDVRELDPEQLWRRIGLVPQKAVPVLRHGRAATCATASPTPPTRSCGRRSRSPRPTTSSRRCPRASTPRSPRAAPTSPAASGSGSRSPAPSSADPEIYLFDDSFSALDLATDARLRAALRPVTARRDGDDRRPAGLDDPSTPTRSSCSRTARSSASARTTSCSTTCPTYAEIVASQLSAEEAA